MMKKLKDQLFLEDIDPILQNLQQYKIEYGIFTEK